MFSLTIFHQDLHHSSSSTSSSSSILKNRIFVNAEYVDELGNRKTQPNDNVKHSNYNDNDQFKYVEKRFLNMMGLPKRPNPKNHHKIPEYFIDLYRWFKHNYDQSAHIDDRFLDSDDNHEINDHRTQSTNSLIGLTTDDLYDIQNSNEHHHSPIEHHRLIRKRRSTQLSRVTLQGPSTTVISHKTSQHQTKLKSHDEHENNVKPVADHNFSSNTNETSRQSNSTHITQMKFDIKLPSDEILTGAELRLYRHSINDKSSSKNEINNNNSDLSDDRKNSMLTVHNNFWPSTYQQQSKNNQETFDISQQILESKVENNSESISSHFSLKNSGEEYSSSSSTSITNNNNNDDVHQYYQRVNIYHLLRPLTDDEQQQQKDKTNELLLKKSKLIDTQVIDIRDSGWLSFDVYPAVEWWLKHPTENYGLIVTIKNYNGKRESSHSHLFVLNDHNDENSTMKNFGQVQSSTISNNDNQQQHQQQQTKSDDDEWHELQPLLITFSNDEKQHQHYLMNKDKLLNRSKRDRKRGGGGNMNGQSNNYDQNNNNNWTNGQTTNRRTKKKNHKNSSKRRNFCHRYHMYFDFKDVGWMDWIVAPPGYHAYYCKGECSYPMSDQMNKTNHAIIQSLINSVNPAVVPEPCCIPTDLSSVTLLYLDHHEKVVLKSYPNMVVEGCGCS